MLRTLVAALGCLVGCHQVIGIEDASVDPTLSESGAAAPLGDGGSPAGGSSSTGGTVGVLPGLSTCERYCQTVTQTCTGAFAQYTTYESCQAVCALLPEGTAGDTSGNSASCRLQAAGQAPLEPSFYCPAAGPGGNGVCGSNCESLCTIVAGVCSAALGDDDDEESPGDCNQSCKDLVDNQTYSVDPEAELFKGNHVQCRLYHATVASETDTEQHCQHALGGSPCN